MSIESIAKEVVEELERAEAKFAPFNSSHEGYAVILEELDELWDVVKLNPKKIEVPGHVYGDKPMPDTKEGVEKFIFSNRQVGFAYQTAKRKEMMRAEAIQVAAMAIRFIKCVCDQESVGPCDECDGEGVVALGNGVQTYFEPCPKCNEI